MILKWKWNHYKYYSLNFKIDTKTTCIHSRLFCCGRVKPDQTHYKMQYFKGQCQIFESSVLRRREYNMFANFVWYVNVAIEKHN